MLDKLFPELFRESRAVRVANTCVKIHNNVRAAQSALDLAVDCYAFYDSAQATRIVLEEDGLLEGSDDGTR